METSKDVEEEQQKLLKKIEELEKDHVYGVDKEKDEFIFRHKMNYAELGDYWYKLKRREMQHGL